MKFLAVLIFALAGLVSLGASANNAGAIAISDGSEYGYGLGDNENQADKAAVKACRDEGGKNCAVVVSFKQCGAYASSSSSVGSGKGGSVGAAESKARADCGGGCKIVFSACTYD